MFALIAALLLFLAVILKLAGVDTGRLDLLLLALGFWALHFAFTVAVPWGRRA